MRGPPWGGRERYHNSKTFLGKLGPHIIAVVPLPADPGGFGGPAPQGSDRMRRSTRASPCGSFDSPRRSSFVVANPAGTAVVPNGGGQIERGRPMVRLPGSSTIEDLPAAAVSMSRREWRPRLLPRASGKSGPGGLAPHGGQRVRTAKTGAGFVAGGVRHRGCSAAGEVQVRRAYR